MTDIQRRLTTDLTRRRFLQGSAAAGFAAFLAACTGKTGASAPASVAPAPSGVAPSAPASVAPSPSGPSSSARLSTASNSAAALPVGRILITGGKLRRNELNSSSSLLK